MDRLHNWIVSICAADRPFRAVMALPGLNCVQQEGRSQGFFVPVTLVYHYPTCTARTANPERTSMRIHRRSRQLGSHWLVNSGISLLPRFLVHLVQVVSCSVKADYIPVSMLGVWAESPWNSSESCQVFTYVSAPTKLFPSSFQIKIWLHYSCKLLVQCCFYSISNNAQTSNIL